MAHRFEALEPFVDDKVKASLQRNGMATAEPADSLVLGSQPDAVTTTLRDYQMIG